MLKYEIIIYWSEEDNAFITEAPELPGCAADGRGKSVISEQLSIVNKPFLIISSFV